MRTQLSQDGYTIHHLHGPWDILVKLSRCLCEDGVERTILVGQPDTYFTIPGRTKAHGKTVSGFVSYDSDRERFTFTAMGKNADAISGESRPCFRSIEP